MNFIVVKAKKRGLTEAWSEQDARKYYRKRARTVFSRLGYDFKPLKRLLDMCPSKKRKKKAVVHQDLTSDNILFDVKTKKINGVIDFGDVQIVDPAVDFSRLWEYGEDFLDIVLFYYKTKDTDLKERSLRWWIYHNINLIEFGSENKIESMIKLGKKQLDKLISLLI